MTPWRWRVLMLVRSLRVRWGSALSSAAAITVLAAVLVAGVSLSVGVREQLGRELDIYGANMVLGGGGSAIEQGMISEALAVPGVRQASGQIFALAPIEDVPLELVGMDVESTPSRGWRMDGDWPGSGQVALGVDVAEALGRGPGDEVRLALPGGEVDLEVSSRVETGTAVDRSAVLDLSYLQGILGREGQVDAVLLRVESDDIPTAAATFEARFPEARIRTVEQVASADARLLDRIELLVGLVSALVLLGSGITTWSTTTAVILRRASEIGLMRSLGARASEVAVIFIAEAAAIGMVGGASGYLLGVGVAQLAALRAFEHTVGPSVVLLPMALAAGVALSVGAALPPLHRALRRAPDALLRST